MDYRRTIQCSIDYIERKLTGKLDLEMVADFAGFSPYYFLRMFRACTGYTPKEYIQLRRLSKAGRDLLFTRDTILTIARKYGFDSQEAFTRAFKKQHGVTPGKLRKTRQAVCYVSPVNALGSTAKATTGVSMTPKIVEMGEMKVIGLKCQTTMKENTIPQLWGQFNTNCNRVPNRTDDKFALGVCPYVDMEHFDENTPFEYITGLAVTTFDNVPEDMVAYTIPAAKYAVFTHKGALDTLQDTYNQIFGTALSENGLELDSKDQIELYDERFKWGEPDSEFDIYIPVK